MGELGEKLWAVISERGVEASGLVYADAAQLARRLKGEKVSGVCIVTDDAARRIPKPQAAQPEPAARR